MKLHGAMDINLDMALALDPKNWMFSLKTTSYVMNSLQVEVSISDEKSTRKRNF